MSAKRLPVLALGVLLPGAAAAENDRALSAGVGWATFSTPGEKMGNMEPPELTPDVGGAVTVTFERAIGTDFVLRAELAGGLFYGGIQDPKTQSNVSYAGLGSVGAVVRFDVLKYVPYAFGGLGAVASTGGPIATDVDLVLVVGGGLDVLASRERSWGVEGKLASFGGDITAFTLGVRATHRWGSSF